MSLLYEKIVQEDLDVGTSAAVTVTNPGGGSLTGTQIGIHSVAVGQSCVEVTWNPDSMAEDEYKYKDVAVPGAALGDFVMVSLSSITSEYVQLTGHVLQADIATAFVYNVSGGTVNIPSGTLRVLVFKSR